MKATSTRIALALSVIVTAIAAQVIVEPRDLGFRIVRRDNISGHHEAVEISMSSIREMDDDGVPVGIGATPPHRVTAFDNISISSGGNGGYRDGIPVQEVSLSAIAMGGATTVTMIAVKYFEGGSIATLDPSSILKVGNETIRIDVQVSDWPFCTLFGQDGGRKCPSEPQDILLEAEGALPAEPIPPPPHTLLIPRCEEETVATFRFVCDPRLTVCTDLTSVKFYLGEADQDPGQAPNTATIQKDEGNGSTSDGLEDFRGTGVYEHNLTRAEVNGFLNVTSLTPGLDYVFWSVWEHDDGSAPESNSQDFDLSRTQYWQCPGTTIDRNFEVGTSLSVSFVVDGPSSLTAVCNDSAWNTDPNPGSGSVEASDAKSAHGITTAKSPPRGRLLLDDEANGTLFQTFCNNDGDEDVLEAGWRWGVGGATFALGELSRVRLASDALLDGLWSPVREGYSTASEEGEITASVEVFESRAIYSALLFYDDVEVVQEGSATDNTRKTATWVAVAFSILLVWILGCCSLRLTKDGHAARTWPAAVARATARSLGGLDDDDDGTSSFGSANSDIDDPVDVEELQIFPMGKTPSEKSLELPSPSWVPAAAPIAGWTTPGSAHSTLNLGTRPSPSRGEAFSLSDAEAASPTPTDVPSYTRQAEPV